MNRSRKKKTSKETIAAWREARVANYVRTRSLDALARMVVELEDAGAYTPEFEIDDAWPSEVRHMRKP